MHSHLNAETPDQVATWVSSKEFVDVQKSINWTKATGAEFDIIYKRYANTPTGLSFGAASTILGTINSGSVHENEEVGPQALGRTRCTGNWDQ